MGQDQGYTLSKQAIQRTAKAVRRVLGDAGSVNNPGIADVDGDVLIKVISSTQIENGKNEYAFHFVTKGNRHAIKTEYTDDQITKAYNWCEFIEGSEPATPVPANTVVPAFLFADEDGNPEYWFTFGGGGALPTGQYKDTYLKMVSQNQVGYGAITARAI